MAAQVRSMETTLAQLRERARLLAEAAVALESDIHMMTIWTTWENHRIVLPASVRATQVSDIEVNEYQSFLAPEIHPKEVLRLVLQAQKVATFLKHSVKRSERIDAITAVLHAFHQIVTEEGLAIPDELEAVIGD